MSMSKFDDLFGDEMFSAYKNTSKYKDDAMMEIMMRKEEFEKNLDNMWNIYQRGVVGQLIYYNKQLDMIKHTGLKVYRNSAGKHKIVSR